MNKTIVVVGMGLSLALVTACDVHIKAIDVKASGKSNSSHGGGCNNETVEGVTDASHPELFDVKIEGADFRKAAGSTPGEACIEKVGGSQFTLKVDSLANNPTECDSPGGTISFKSMRLEATDVATLAPLELECADATANVAIASEIEAVANACGELHASKISEWMRQAFNAHAKSIRLNGVIDCSDDACFVMSTTVKSRLTDVTAHVMKGCSATASN